MKSLQLLLVLASFAGAVSASAQIVRVSAGNFTPQASVITFSEYSLGTQNPVYNLPTASLGNITVSFGAYFVGQTPTGAGVVTLSGSPAAGPLALAVNPNQYSVIVGDGANPTSPVLSGRPTYNGPVSVLFSAPVAAVGLSGGFFDAIGGTSIEAFGVNGASIGLVTNQALGIEFFGLTTLSGASVISGISFYITGNEPAGFAIDNLTFGSASEIIIPGNGNNAVPEPSTYGLMGAALLMGLVVYKRKRSK